MNETHATTGLVTPDVLPRRDWLIVLGMLVGVVIFYRGSYQLPVSAVGLALFSVLALWRPHLALLFVPLTVPLFFMPKGLWDARFGIRDAGIRVPLHEVLLLVTVGAAGVRWLIRRVSSFPHILASSPLRLSSAHLLASLRSHLPVLLFLLAGTLGVLVAPPEGRGAALREWRWLIVEPLIFSCLVRRASAALRVLLVAALVLGGALVGAVGLLQFVGLNLAPLIGDKVGFSDDRVLVEGVRRVSSVYGHPNNLGLYMGRVWPLAGALALAAAAGYRGAAAGSAGRRGAVGPLLFYGVCSVVCLGGLLVSFSKGALVGAVAAGVVLAVSFARPGAAGVGWLRGRGVLVAAGVVLAGVALVALAGLLGVERLNVLGESSMVRVKTWRSALLMVRDHPLVGIGLDQFVRVYPQYIDASLRGSSERFASHPHNVLLDVWLRMGLAGVAAFAWLIVRLFRGLVAGGDGGAGALRVGVAAALVAALVHGLVDNFYFVPDLAFFWWLAVGVMGGDG